MPSLAITFCLRLMRSIEYCLMLRFKTSPNQPKVTRKPPPAVRRSCLPLSCDSLSPRAFIPSPAPSNKSGPLLLPWWAGKHHSLSTGNTTHSLSAAQTSSLQLRPPNLSRSFLHCSPAIVYRLQCICSVEFGVRTRPISVTPPAFSN